MAHPLLEKLASVRPDCASEPSMRDPLEQQLRTICEAARSAWPELDVSPEQFVAYLAPRLSKRSNVSSELHRLHTADLYLACACSLGFTVAIQRFEQAYFGEIERAFRRIGSPTFQLADVQQIIREKFFVAAPGKSPKIVDYSGQGPLRTWVRVSVVRTLQNLATRGPKETPLEGKLLAEFPASSEDPELEHLRQLYRAEFKAAFNEAVSAMSLNDRVLLHQRFVGQLSFEDLADAYDVHVNTVSRWLARARQALEAGVRSALAARLKISEAQFTSIVRLVQSQLDVTLGQLAPGAPNEPTSK